MLRTRRRYAAVLLSAAIGCLLAAAPSALAASGDVVPGSYIVAAPTPQVSGADDVWGIAPRESNADAPGMIVSANNVRYSPG